MTKILFIEDVADSTKLVRKVLTQKGYDFMWAKNAVTGLQLALEHKPDLILWDLGFPNTDGQNLARLFNEEPSLSGIPLVAMTVSPEKITPNRGEPNSFDAYIGKPFRVQPFLEEIEALLS